jgi:hypothetical protein
MTFRAFLSADGSELSTTIIKTSYTNIVLTISGPFKT